MTRVDIGAIAQRCREVGLDVVTISGSGARGRGPMSGIRTLVIHHTGTARSFRRGVDYPTLAVVRDGRPGLAGPLSQFGLGRNGTVYVIASGRANHTGRTHKASQGNAYAIGIEAEGAFESWPKEQYDAYVLLAAVIKSIYPSIAIERHAEIAAPRGRKTDASFNGNSFRQAVARVDIDRLRRTGGKAPITSIKPEGLVESMSNESSVSYGKDQNVPARSRVRLRCTSDGEHRLAPAIKGRNYFMVAGVGMYRIQPNTSVQLRLVVAVYNANKSLNRVVAVGRTPITFHPNQSGWPYAEITLAEKCKINVPDGGFAEYQVEVVNNSDSPVTATAVSGNTLYS